MEAPRVHREVWVVGGASSTVEKKMVVMVGLGESLWGLTVEPEVSWLVLTVWPEEETPMVVEEEIERLEMEEGCWIRLVELVECLNSPEEEKEC